MFVPSPKTEVEVRFVEGGKGGTRVEVEHRDLDLFGPRRDEMRGIFDSESGGSGLLASFARAAEASARRSLDAHERGGVTAVADAGAARS